MFEIDNLKLIMLIPSYLVFLFSFVVHESAHAWMACKLGDGTARYYISLNPVPHIRRTPFGMVVIPLITYFTIGWPLGFASVPINYLWAQQNPRKYGLVSLAGPAANFLLSLGFVIVAGVYILMMYKLGGAIEQDDNFYQLLRFGMSLNVVLIIFNIIPAPPLDGSTIPCLFIPGKHMKSYLQVVWNPSMVLPGMLIAYIMFSGVFNRIGVPMLLMLDELINVVVWVGSLFLV